MKVINLHRDENKTIQQAIAHNRQAQRILYEKYSPKMLSVCRQYVKDVQHAEDVMITAFMKVFTNLGRYENKGSFEGWIRRIMIHECIDFLRVKKNFISHDAIDVLSDGQEISLETTDFSVDDIQYLIDNLPDGCRTVFNLYAVEGYKHQEIAKMLNINEGTSKSQLAHARKLLQNKINLLTVNENGTE